MEDKIRPTKTEKEFLTLAYNRFYDIFEEVMDDSFWQKEDWYRFSKIKDGFAVYTELLNYPPIQWIVEHMKTVRPPMEAEIGSELFKFIRNVIVHFPFFQSWNKIWIKKTMVNWYKEGKSIDKFLSTYQGRDAVKYRFWEPEKKRMTYLSINFPKEYTEDMKIYLKDILPEKEGLKFSFALMKQILDTQVEK
jgi:hypothetical protein